jgi:uncharacterized membrane protein YkoI
MVYLASLALIGGCASNKSKPTAGSPEADTHQKLTAADVPANIMSTVNNRLPGATVTSVEKENENGGIVYDFELTQQGKKYEMDIKDDGTLTEIEKQVDAPASVKSTVLAKYPGATIGDVMEVDVVTGKDERPDRYEVTITGTDGKEKEVNVGMDGKIEEEKAEEK